MIQRQSTTRPSGITHAISNTGPLISVFQSNSFSLLTQIFADVRISGICKAELIQHGWKDEVKAAKSKLVVVKLTVAEKQQALSVAQQIAEHRNTNDPIAENHLGEAQVITIALRDEYRNDSLLLDELAARSVAKQMNVKLSGFPGVLLLAVRKGLISAEELKIRLETCQAQGTYYGTNFIQQVYEMAK